MHGKLDCLAKSSHRLRAASLRDHGIKCVHALPRYNQYCSIRIKALIRGSLTFSSTPRTSVLPV
eukprot:3941968-Rhodomonas_salina.2